MKKHRMSLFHEQAPPVVPDPEDVELHGDPDFNPIAPEAFDFDDNLAMLALAAVKSPGSSPVAVKAGPSQDVPVALKSDPDGTLKFSVGPWVDAISQVSGPDGDGDEDDPEPVPVPEGLFQRKRRPRKISESFAERLARELLRED